MNTLLSAWAVLAKDVRSEFRTRYALSSILLFALVSIAAVSFAFRGRPLEERQAAALVWVIVFFAATVGLSRPFVQEAESRTELLLRQAARPEAVWLGKLLFNVGLMAALEAVIFPVYSGLMDVHIERPLILAGVAGLGAVSLAGATTIVAAMVARARSRASVFAVTALPILLPALMFLINASGPSFGAAGSAEAARSGALVLISYTGIVIVLSWMLFPVVWED